MLRLPIPKKIKFTKTNSYWVLDLVTNCDERTFRNGREEGGEKKHITSQICRDFIRVSERPY
jgi:hypothetical protein